MSISKQIKGIVEQKAAILTQMEDLSSKEDALDEGEQKNFDNFEAQVKDLNARQKNLEKTEAMIAANTSVPVEKTVPVEKKSAAVVTPRIENQDKSLFIARQAHALFMAGGNKYGASEYAKNVLGDTLLSNVFKMPANVLNKTAVDAGDSVTAGWAAELVQVNEANEAFIEMLRPMSVLARFPARQMSFDGYGSIKIPRQTTGTTGGFLAENAAIPVGALAFDSITLDPKKMGTIVASSNELLARSTPTALGLIRDDILQGIATAIDTKFVSNDAAVAGVSPAGIQTFDSSPTASTGSDLNAITADLKAAINQMLSLNMPMSAPIWMMNPTTANGLRFIRDGLGSYAFQDQMNSGNLVGYPFLESTTIPANIVMLVDGSQIIVASALAPQISISGDTSIHMETAPATDIGGAATPVQSMFQTDSTAIRGLVSLDWNSRYADAVAVITGVSWA